ncbi:hypothetical protein GCM10009409_39510 [Shewanella saliphila]|uniref:Uncharacterized protein n=1 Tax=Shewanella saliphila TaxID=2282698 RepID=A0ABQ2QB36_9GAMM|nr:hypothetical protein GCM10009409_39510 [Shewanella saliphila]
MTTHITKCNDNNSLRPAKTTSLDQLHKPKPLHFIPAKQTAA